MHVLDTARPCLGPQDSAPTHRRHHTTATLNDDAKEIVAISIVLLYYTVVAVLVYLRMDRNTSAADTTADPDAAAYAYYERAAADIARSQIIGFVDSERGLLY